MAGTPGSGKAPRAALQLQPAVDLATAPSAAATSLGVSNPYCQTAPEMSSLNPFAKRREAKEAKVKEQMQAYEASQLDGTGGGQFGGQSFDAGSFDQQQRAPRAPDASYDDEDFDKYLPKSAKADQAAPEWSGGHEPPSRARQCFGKLQSGFLIGASLGGAIGTLYGTYAAIKYKHILYLPIAIAQAGGGFGFFLACGTVIRCAEPEELSLHEAQSRATLLTKHAPLTPRAEARMLCAEHSLHELDARSRSAVVAAICDQCP